MIPVALTIAGSDPSGGAGVQADLKTFQQRSVYGTSVITALTVQNTARFDRIEPLDPELVGAQLDAVVEDLPPRAAKTGALVNAGIVRAVAARFARFDFPLVVDPVMAAKHGRALLDAGGVAALVTELLPRALLVTPNLDEAAALAGMEVGDLDSMAEAARRIAALGAEAVLVKGGHLAGDAVDLLLWKGESRQYRAERIETPGDRVITNQPLVDKGRYASGAHGTGCVYSAAITAELARGLPLPEAVAAAKSFITAALRSRVALGKGFGPVLI
jgi:hydroxymethylpyrimidine/phosphomethylpyrimidine kinase